MNYDVEATQFRQVPWGPETQQSNRTGLRGAGHTLAAGAELGDAPSGGVRSGATAAGRSYLSAPAFRGRTEERRSSIPMGERESGPRVFISYTSHDATGTSASRSLSDLLAKSGFEPIRDEAELEPGDEWNDELYAHLAECHAALVVISPGVGASEWVQREVAILLHRLKYMSPLIEAGAMDTGFVLIPVLAGVTRDVWTQSGALGSTLSDLGRLQHVMLEESERLLDALAPVRAHVQYIDAEVQAERWLAEVLLEATAAALDRVHKHCLDSASGMESSKRVLRVQHRHHKLRARQVASAVLALPPDEAIRALRPLLKEIRQAENVRNMLLPNWVSAEAASRLRSIVENSPTTTVINSRLEFTANYYVRRAERWHTPTWNYVALNNVHGGEDQLVALRHELVLGLMRVLLCDTEQDLLARIPEVPDELVIVFLPGFVESNVLRALEQEFPPVVFLVGAEGLDQQSANERLGDAIYLEPPIDDATEQRARKQVLRAYRSFDTTMKSQPPPAGDSVRNVVHDQAP